MPPQPSADPGSARKSDTASALKWLGVAATCVSITLGGRQLVNAYTDRRDKREAVGRHLAAAQLEQSAGALEAAWTHLDSASKVDPRDERMRRARELTAMRWLERYDFFGHESDPAALAARLSQPLAEGVARAAGQDRADMLAHLGWSAFLRSRFSGTSGPDSLMRQALAIDPKNPYAHAMLGFFALWNDGAGIDSSRAHFAAARASNRDREYVNRLRWSALLNASRRVSGADEEVIRVADESRKANEMPDGATRAAIFSYCYFSQIRDPDTRRRILDAVPAAEHSQTFRWLFAAKLADSTGSEPGYLMADALIAERAGKRDEAMAGYRRLLKESPTSTYVDMARERMSKKARAL